MRNAKGRTGQDNWTDEFRDLKSPGAKDKVECGIGGGVWDYKMLIYETFDERFSKPCVSELSA